MAYKTITIQAGDHTWLPRGANLVSITFNGEVEVESDCLDFSNVTGMQCWGFRINANDDTQYCFDRIIIGDQVYLFEESVCSDEFGLLNAPFNIIAQLAKILPQDMWKAKGCRDLDFGPGDPVYGSDLLLITLPSNLDAPKLGFYDNNGDFGADHNRGELIADSFDDCLTCPEGMLDYPTT